MVKQPGATCPGNPRGVIADPGQVRHRLDSGVDLVAGGASHGASAEELRDRSPPTVTTVGISAQELAGGSAAILSDSGGIGGPPDFTDLSAGDLTAARNPAGREELSLSIGAVFSTHGASGELQFARPGGGAASSPDPAYEPPWLKQAQGTDARFIAAAQLIPHTAELAKEEYSDWADGLFPSLSCVKTEYRDWAIGCELMCLEQEGVPMPTRVPVLPVSVPVSTAAETPLERLKARLERIRERRSSQTLSQSEPQPPVTQPAPGTPAQQQRQEQEFSPVFENSSPVQAVQRSSKVTPIQTPRTPQPPPEFVQARKALAHYHDESVTQEEARSAAVALQEILSTEPGSTPTSQLIPRRFPDLDPEFGWSSEPEPEPMLPVPEPEPEPEPECVQQPVRCSRKRRGRRGRRGGRKDGTSKPAESRLLAVEEPAMCYSPERRFDAKERRERPPRRYDKGNEPGQGEE